MDKKFIHADGHPIWGHISVSCIRTRSGAVENFISQIIDITEAVESRARPRSGTSRTVNSHNGSRQTDLLTAGLRSAAAYVSSILPGDLQFARFGCRPATLRPRSSPATSTTIGGSRPPRCLSDRRLRTRHRSCVALGVGAQHAVLGAVFQTAELAPPRSCRNSTAGSRWTSRAGTTWTMWCGIYELLADADEQQERPPRSRSAARLRPYCLQRRLIGFRRQHLRHPDLYIVPPGCRIRSSATACMRMPSMTAVAAVGGSPGCVHRDGRIVAGRLRRGT